MVVPPFPMRTRRMLYAKHHTRDSVARHAQETLNSNNQSQRPSHPFRKEQRRSHISIRRSRQQSLHRFASCTGAAGVSTGIAPEAVESLTSRDLGIDSSPIRARTCPSSCGSRRCRNVRRRAWNVASGKVIRNASGTGPQKTGSSRRMVARMSWGLSSKG